MIGIYVLLFLAMILIVKFLKGKMKLILAGVLILIAIYCVILDADRNRVFSNRLPIFAKSSELKDYESKSTEIYKGLGYRIEVDKIEEGKVSAITMYLGNKVIAGIINDYVETDNNSDEILLDNKDYLNEWELNFFSRDNQEITEILKLDDYSIKTFGGDVNIIVEGDMAYFFQDALKQNIITSEQIIDRAKRDSEEGKIKSDMYKDGGSMEYYYDDYTILKFNTVDGNKDLIIGKKGSIMNEYSNFDTNNKRNIELNKVIFECEVNRNNIIVKPNEGTNEIKSSDKISINVEKWNSEFIVGDKLKVTYDGFILETYPAQIHAIDIKKINL